MVDLAETEFETNATPRRGLTLWLMTHLQRRPWAGSPAPHSYTGASQVCTPNSEGTQALVQTFAWTVEELLTFQGLLASWEQADNRSHARR